MYNDDEWQDFREQCLIAAKERNDSLIKEFLKSAKYTGTVGYYIDVSYCTANIYAKSPGVLIGKAGQNAFDFERRLSEEFGGEWKVKFTEVWGGFVSNCE